MFYHRKMLTIRSFSIKKIFKSIIHREKHSKKRSVGSIIFIPPSFTELFPHSSSICTKKICEAFQRIFPGKSHYKASQEWMHSRGYNFYFPPLFTNLFPHSLLDLHWNNTRYISKDLSRKISAPGKTRMNTCLPFRMIDKVKFFFKETIYDSHRIINKMYLR